MLVDAVVWTCWGLFAVVWIGGALYNARRAPRARRRSLRGSLWLLLALPVWIVARRVLEPVACCALGFPYRFSDL